MSMTETNDQDRRVIAKLDEAPPPSMEIASQRTSGVVFTNFGQVIEFAREMSMSDVGVRKHLRSKVGACIAIITQAIEWEMSPFAVASKSYVVNDQIAYEAQLINAVILRRAPIVGRFKISFEGEGDSRRCTVALAMRDGGPDATYTSPLFGRIQPKNSPLWKNDPDQQLFYASSRALCRRHFPDVLLGVYSVDELIDSEPIQTARVAVRGAGTVDARLNVLAEMPIPGAMFRHDPETGEIIENNSPPSPTDRGEVAAADRTSSVEIGAGPSANDPGGDPAPDPQKPAPQQGPQEGAGLSRSPQAGPAPSDPARSGPEITSGRAAAGQAIGAPATPPKPLSEEDKANMAILAEMMEAGVERAQLGPGALSKWLDGLPPFVRSLLPNVLVEEWIGIARARAAQPDDAARRARIAEITANGDLAASHGQVSLNNFLDAITEGGERPLISNIKVRAWQETARRPAGAGRK